MNSVFKFLAVLALIGVVHAQCTAPQVEVNIEKITKSWCYEEKAYIYEGATTTGTAVWLKEWQSSECQKTLTYTTCLTPFTQYTLYMTDTYGDGWSAGATMTITYGGLVLVDAARGTGTGSSVTFAISSILSASSQIKYTNVAQTGTTWTQPSFQDTTWTAYTAGTFPAVSAITRYYRATATYTPNANIYGIILTLKTKSGYALYINGIEAYRWNLIAGATATTPASGTSDAYVTRKIGLSASTYNAAAGSLTFAVELHNMSVDPAEVDGFEITATLVVGAADSVTTVYLPGTPTCDPATGPSAGEVCANLFDNNDNTKYYWASAGTSTHYIIYDGAIQMNGYQIVSGNDSPARDPKNFKIYGTKDGGVTWFFMHSVTNNAFASRKVPYNFLMPSQGAVLNGLKIEITANNGVVDAASGNPSYQFEEIRPLLVNTPLLSAGIQYESSSITLMTGIEVNVVPTSTGVYNIRISPALPDGLYIDNETGKIYGTATTASTSIYTVTATVGSTGLDVTTQITITLTSCEQPAYANVRFVKHNRSKANDERFNVYTEANVSVLESIGYNNGADQTYDMCVSAGKLKFVLIDQGNNGWDAGAYLDVYLRYDGATHKISRLYLLDGTTATYYVNVKLDIASKATGWKYYDNAVIDPSWYMTSFSDVAWPQLTFAPYPNSITKIQLFRKTLTGITRANYKGVELTFKSKAGVVIYANGAEVYRSNLPAGPITTATTATGGDSTVTWRKVSFPISVLGTGGNTLNIAIGLVELVAAPYALDFDATLRLLPVSDVLQVYSGAQSSDYPWGSDYNMFDLNVETRFISGLHDSQTEHYVQVVFNTNDAIFANKYCIISNYDAPQHDPVDWKIYGTNDGTTWDLLATETNISWEGRRQRQCFYIPTLDKAKRGYRFAPTKARVISAENRYAASEMELYIEDIDNLVIPPLAMTPTNLVAYKDVPVPALLSSSEYWHNFSIQPALPTPLTMDYSNGYINGIPATLLSPTPYTISATDIKGNTATTTITFSVVTCASPNTILSLEIVFEGGSPVEASWEIKTPSNTVLDSRTTSVAYATETFTYCSVAGTYTFTFGDTANNGWNTGNYYIKNRMGQTLASGTVEYGNSPKTVQVTIGGLVEAGAATWKYLLDGSQPASNWYTSAFSDAAWQSGFSGAIPAPTSSSTTQYYRTTFTVASIDSVNNAAFEIAAKSYAGIAVYINGNEVFRSNLPSGTLSQSTTATTSLSDYQYFYSSISINSNTIVAGSNILAVEVHKKDTIPTTNGFDAYISYIANNSYRVMDGVAWSDVEKTGFEGTDKLFDNSISTKVLAGPRCVGAIYQWTYNNGRREFANQYKITDGNDCNTRHPSGWVIEGSNDNGATWTILHGTRNQYFTAYRQTLSYDFYSAVPYNSYRMIVTECNNEALDYQFTAAICGAGNMQLSELGFYATNTPAACAADGAWGPAPEGGYSFQSCGAGYKGMKRRACTNGVLGSEQNLCVVDPPSSFSYPQSIYTFHKGVPANASPVCSGAELTFAITPSLPVNLQFSTSNGVISGTPTANANLASYNVTCGNTSGTLSFVLQITVDTLSCSADSGWPMTEINQQATQNCLSTDYEGQKTRSCTYNGSAATWGPVSDNCVLRLPTIRYDNTAYTFYKGDAITSLVPITQYQVTSYSINPQLPSGLSFSTSNGQIYGTPAVAVSGQTYTIQATNARGSGSTTITISVLTVTCASDGTWPQTERGLTAYVACPNGQTGMQSRLCKAVGTGAASGVWELADSASCFIYTPGENPGDGKLFVNLPLQIQGISASAFKTPSTYEIFRKSIANQLSTKHSISSSSVQITDINDATTAAALYAVATNVNVRVLTPEAQKEAVTNTLSTYVKATDSTGLLATLQSSTDPNLRQVTGTSMKGNISYTTNALSGGIITLIVILVVLVVLIVAVVAFCLFTRMKGKSSKNGKKLGASKKPHKDAKADSKSTKTSGKAVKV